jgi:hypothetical protein
MPARGWEQGGVHQCRAGQDEAEDERRPGFAGAPVSFLESGPARDPRSVPKPLSVAELWSSCFWNGCDSAGRPLEVAGPKKNRVWIE